MLQVKTFNWLNSVCNRYLDVILDVSFPKNQVSFVKQDFNGSYRVRSL